MRQKLSFHTFNLYPAYVFIVLFQLEIQMIKIIINNNINYIIVINM